MAYTCPSCRARYTRVRYGWWLKPPRWTYDDGWSRESGRPRDYACSDRCYRAKEAARLRAYRAAHPTATITRIVGCAGPGCAETFTPKRADARFCSTRCRVAAHRAARAQNAS